MLKWENLVSWLLGPLFTIGVFLFQFIRHPNLEGPDGVATLLWTLISYLIGHHLILIFTDIKNKAKDQRQHQEVIEAILQSGQSITRLMTQFNVSLISGSEVQAAITAKVLVARAVKNTFVNMKEITGMRTMEAAELISRYEAFLGKGVDVTWHDIVGVSDFIDGRFHSIFKDGTMAALGKHTVSVLDNRTPIINFLLCSPNKGMSFSDLYFGWIHNSSQSVSIFHTTDPGLISLFNSYFNQMIELGSVTPLAMDYSVPSDQRFSTFWMSQFVGRWISVSITSRTKLETRDMIDYADLCITHTEAGWRVIGTISRNDRITGEIQSLGCIVLKDTLYYRYELRDRLGQTWRQGIGGYRIDPSPNYTTMSGFYTSDNLRNNRLTFAKRIGEDEKVTMSLVKEFTLSITQQMGSK